MKAIMVVKSGPSDPSREDEYNDWYSNTHIPQVVETPGFVSARRYKLRSGDAEGPQYLAIYEIDADVPEDARAALSARGAAGEVERNDALSRNPPPVVAIYELIE